MKRLMKKATEELVDIPDMSNMTELKELDEADIRHDRCPVCKAQPLKREDGFKACTSCNSTYKVFDGKGYLVSVND